MTARSMSLTTKDTIKQSWIPILLAFLIPAATVGGSLLIMELRGTGYWSQEEQQKVEQAPATSEATITIKVVNEDGLPLPGKQLNLLHKLRPQESQLTPTNSTRYTRTTDSAGFVGLSLQRQGTLTVSVEGMEETQSIREMEHADTDYFELVIVASEEGSQGT